VIRQYGSLPTHWARVFASFSPTLLLSEALRHATCDKAVARQHCVRAWTLVSPLARLPLFVFHVRLSIRMDVRWEAGWIVYTFVVSGLRGLAGAGIAFGASVFYFYVACFIRDVFRSPMARRSKTTPFEPSRAVAQDTKISLHLLHFFADADAFVDVGLCRALRAKSISPFRFVGQG
jgi:hypothetical protein